MANKRRKPPSTNTSTPKSTVAHQPLEHPKPWYKRFFSFAIKLGVIVFAFRGGIQVVSQDIRSVRDLYREMDPQISVELKPNGTAISKAVFKFTNGGPGELRDVEHRFLIDYVGDRSYRPYPGERPTFRNDYSFYGTLLPKGTITLGILPQFHHLMEREEWTRIGICHDLAFRTVPFDWINKWYPVGKQQWTIGYLVDKKAGIDYWSQRSCDAVMQIMQQVSPHPSP